MGVALFIHGNQGIHGVLLPVGTANQDLGVLVWEPLLDLRSMHSINCLVTWTCPYLHKFGQYIMEAPALIGAAFLGIRSPPDLRNL